MNGYFLLISKEFFKSDLLIDGVELTPDSTFDNTSNRFGYLHLKSEYHPKLFANTKYIISSDYDFVIRLFSNIKTKFKENGFRFFGGRRN